jgi:hypothetical protein
MAHRLNDVVHSKKNSLKKIPLSKENSLEISQAVKVILQKKSGKILSVPFTDSYSFVS